MLTRSGVGDGTAAGLESAGEGAAALFFFRFFFPSPFPIHSETLLLCPVLLYENAVHKDGVERKVDVTLFAMKVVVDDDGGRVQMDRMFQKSTMINARHLLRLALFIMDALINRNL